MATFTTIATGVGLAVSAGTTIASFAQAAEQNQKKQAAEAEAAKAYDEARKRLDVNFYEQLSIQKEPYELARRELLSQGALATQQLAEGDARALAGGVGRVQIAQQLGQEGVTTAQQQEQTQMDRLVAGEDARLGDVETQIELQRAMAAQQAAADAEKAESMAIGQGMAGVTSIVGQVASLAPLFEKAAEVNALKRIKNQAIKQGIDPSKIDLSDPSKLKDMGINLNKRQLASIPTGVKSVSDLETYVKTGTFGADAERYKKFLSGDSGRATMTPPLREVPPQYLGGSGGDLIGGGGQQELNLGANVFSQQLGPYGQGTASFFQSQQPPTYMATAQGTPVKDLMPVDPYVFEQPVYPGVDPYGQGQQSIDLPVTSYGYGFRPY
jgi:hypothetical protein